MHKKAEILRGYLKTSRTTPQYKTEKSHSNIPEWLFQLYTEGVSINLYVFLFFFLAAGKRILFKIKR